MSSRRTELFDLSNDWKAPGAGRNLWKHVEQSGIRVSRESTSATRSAASESSSNIIRVCLTRTR